MRTIERYISGIFFRNFLLSLTGLAFLFSFQAFLGELLDREFPAPQLLVYNALNLPKTITQITPAAVLMATVLTLSGLSRTNELVACYSLGIGLKRIVAVILSLVFLTSCFVLMMQDRILPPMFKRRTTFYHREMKHQENFLMDLKQDKIWYRSGNLIYNLRFFDVATKTIHGMAVYSFDPDFNLTQVVNAEKANPVEGGWKLRNGTTTFFSETDPFPFTERFDEKELKIAEKPEDFQELEKEVDGLRIRDMWRYIRRIRDAGTDTKSYEVKFHSRFSLSFVSLVMCVLAVPFSVSRRREGGFARDLGLSLGFTLVYWLFYSVGLSLGTGGIIPPWMAAWLPSAIFAAGAGVLVAKTR